MELNKLIAEIKNKRSFLCIGLDVDLEKIPKHLLNEPDPIFSFNKAIIDATHDFCVAYKPNTAFYEAYGVDGWISLNKTIEYLNKNFPNHFTIADAKRGDIGNTGERYAKAFLEDLDFDSITIAPYMGKDSVEPFLRYENKFAILLALTSNEGAFDFQTSISGNEELYKKVIRVTQGYANAERLMYVVGATKPSYIKKIREIIPHSFLLVPGVGAQGGDMKEVCKYGLTKDIGLLVNSSRGIIYASSGDDFAHMATVKARELKMEMASILDNSFIRPQSNEGKGPTQ